MSSTGSLRDYWVTATDFKRVIYAKNPLAEVVFQVRYPRELKLETGAPVEFQERIREFYPILEIQDGFEFVPQSQPAPVQVQPVRSYMFYSADRTSFIALTSSFLSLATQQYKDWNDFQRNIRIATETLLSIYPIGHLNRIGLRYRNLIDRNTLSLAGVPWSELINPVALGWLNHSDLERWTQLSTSSALFRSDLVSCQLHSGIVQNAKAADQYAFLLDADYFLDVPILLTSQQLLSITDDLHSYSGPLFRWCIKDRLHNALEPSAPK